MFLLKYILIINDVKNNVCYKLFKLDSILVVSYTKYVGICHFFQSTNYILQGLKYN